MRFAGARFRQGDVRQGRITADDGSVGSYAYRPSVQGLEQSMAQMPDQSASRYSKTGQPSFQIGEFKEPDFRA